MSVAIVKARPLGHGIHACVCISGDYSRFKFGPGIFHTYSHMISTPPLIAPALKIDYI